MNIESKVKTYFSAIAGRVAVFTVVFSVIPGVLAAAAAATSSSRLEVLRDAFGANPGFFLTTILHACIASFIVSVVLACGSFLGWSRETRYTWLRTARVLFCLCVIGYILFPAFAASIPIFRNVPVWLMALGLVAVVAATIVPQVTRPRMREAAFMVGACVFFFASPIFTTAKATLQETAGRTLNENDVVLIGIDSVSYPDVADVLADFTPQRAAKSIYENASTPLASTNSAWRTIFSGIYPVPTSLPGDLWGRERQSWLPDELTARDYNVVMVQDDPSTNVFAESENIIFGRNQGWKWMAETLLWRTLFPLSELAASWWLDCLGGPVLFSSRVAYQPEYFQEHVLRQVALYAAHGPVMLGAHTCFAHTPIHLQLKEILRLDGWWRKPPARFVGGASYFANSENLSYSGLASARITTTRSLLRRFLARLEEAEIVGKARVMILSDHGMRASWASPDAVHHVVLTQFIPGRKHSEKISAPVSLVDIAPTIRKMLLLPAQQSDGLVLDGELPIELGRETRRLTKASVGAGARALLNPGQMRIRGNVTYAQDGTFGISDSLREEIQSTIERESRSAESLRYILRNSVGGAK